MSYNLSLEVRDDNSSQITVYIKVTWYQFGKLFEVEAPQVTYHYGEHKGINMSRDRATELANDYRALIEIGFKQGQEHERIKQEQQRPSEHRGEDETGEGS